LNNPERTDIKICIIGAGASSLTAAYYLEKLGYKNVTLFEKEDYVGGKVLSYKYEGKTYDLGAIIIGNKDNYKVCHELLAAHDIPLENFTTPDVAYLDGCRCSFEQYFRNQYSLARAIRAFMSMFFLAIKFRKYLKNGFVDASPELFINFEDFVRKHKIEPLADTLSPFLIGCGYGCYEEIPAIYLFRFLWWFFKSCLRFKHLVKILRGDEISNITTCKNGCQELWIKIAEKLHVETIATIEKIVRTEKDQKIEIVVNNQTYQFDRLFISSPLDETIQFMDVSEEEKELFSKIEYTDYYVTLFKGEGFNKTLFVRDHIHPHTKGRTVAICCRHCDSNVYMAYQMAPPGAKPEELMEMLGKDVEQLGGKINEVITQKHWRYFPRVSREVLEDNFYRRLDKLQGQKGTYYIGAVMNFETLENTVDFAKELVIKYFAQS
jgi:oxygen-dependent protoporphyrinogen oxidase